jgi:septum site-determining protein MinD
MSTVTESVALVGVAGGAGTTRLTVETAATLARDDRDVAVFDAAFATQGLAQYVHGRIDVDVTRLVTDDDIAPSDAFVDLATDTPGRVAVCPAYAAFSGLAAAKTSDAAERYGEVLRETAAVFDAVLVDTPPVGDNPSVAAVDATDRTALVAPATQRGCDALPHARDRLADIDATADVVLANATRDDQSAEADEPIDEAAVTVPRSDVTTVTGAPVCTADATGRFPRALVDAAETLFDTTLDVDVEPQGVTDRLLGR